MVAEVEVALCYSELRSFNNFSLFQGFQNVRQIIFSDDTRECFTHPSQSVFKCGCCEYRRNIFCSVPALFQNFSRQLNQVGEHLACYLVSEASCKPSLDFTFQIL